MMAGACLFIPRSAFRNPHFIALTGMEYELRIAAEGHKDENILDLFVAASKNSTFNAKMISRSRHLTLAAGVVSVADLCRRRY
jgi:hypothetical protein